MSDYKYGGFLSSYIGVILVIFVLLVIIAVPWA